MRVRACVHVRVRACVRAYVCVCVCVRARAQPVWTPREEEDIVRDMLFIIKLGCELFKKKKKVLYY